MHVHAMATNVAKKEHQYQKYFMPLLDQSQNVNSGVRKGIWPCITSTSFKNSHCHVVTKSDRIIIIIIYHQQQNV